jgi:phosphatidate cytidylyltransferase
MLGQRVKLVLLYLPVLLVVAFIGGWVFTVGVAVVLALAGLEYGRMFWDGRRRPAVWLIAGFSVLLSIDRHLFQFEHASLLLGLVLLAGLVWHLIDYERGASRSGSDFALTTTGILYIGWLGSYFVSLRQLPAGQWWLLLALPSVWLADMAAYFVGSQIGRHRLSPRVSPNKSVEGYLAGIIIGTPGTAVLAWLWGSLAGISGVMTPLRGLVLGLVISVLAPLGDLAISMFKRELGLKDTGSMLGPHGGALDRMDTWLWTSMLSYYIALAFIH